MLLDLLRGLTPGELAGGFGLSGVVPAPSRIQQGYRHQLALLPPATQLLLLVAAVNGRFEGMLQLWSQWPHIRSPGAASG